MRPKINSGTDPNLQNTLQFIIIECVVYNQHRCECGALLYKTKTKKNEIKRRKLCYGSVQLQRIYGQSERRTQHTNTDFKCILKWCVPGAPQLCVDISSQVRNSYENGHFNVLNIYIGIYLVFFSWTACVCVCVCSDYGSPVQFDRCSYNGTSFHHILYLIWTCLLSAP